MDESNKKFGVIEVSQLSVGEPEGIADYVKKLIESLEKHPDVAPRVSGSDIIEDVTHFKADIIDWSKITNNKEFLDLVQPRQDPGFPQIIHMQIPHYGLNPAITADVFDEFAASAVTVHSFSQKDRQTKAKLLEWIKKADIAVFTTEKEWNAVAEQYPEVREKSKILPVGPTMVPSINYEPQGQIDHIVRFGAFRTGSAITSGIELAELLEKETAAGNLPENIEYRIIGTVLKLEIFTEAASAVYDLTAKDVTELEKFFDETPDGRLKYKRNDLEAFFKARESQKRLKHTNFYFDVTPEEYEEHMKGAVSYQPYSDGVTGRRSTLANAMAFGVPVVAPSGQHTTEELRHTVIIANTPDKALQEIMALVNEGRTVDGDTQKSVEQIRGSMTRYVNRHDLDWSKIGDGYYHSFREALARQSDSTKEAGPSRG